MQSMLSRGALAVIVALVGPAAVVLAQDRAHARSLAATCANCHGTDGQAIGEMAPLAGQPATKILSSVAAFKSGTRPATVMHQIAKGYSDEQMQLIAGYFAALPAPKTGAPR